MNTSTRVTTILFALTLAFNSQAQVNLPIAPGPFVGSFQSLSNYACPDWFRDAKFGIWSHWGPQAVPMAGDWYAKHMYVQGHPQYKHHLENYGHPSTNGYKEIIALWKAEKWDPERLMSLYERAGAKYFVSMASHHDNFHLWNSQFNKRWNSLNMGPKRDVVGDWARAARKHGLRFGVSEHLGASFTWFQDSHKSDKTGPLAGVPYDGADPKYQDLYHWPADPNDKAWYSNNPRWQQHWYNCIKDLVDNYQLDLLYTDGGIPFGNEVGRSLVAHLYNNDLQRRGAARDRMSTRGAELLRGASQNARDVQVVYSSKQRSYGMWIEDLERGVMPGINPHPWQTDTSIGDWYYNKNWKFRPVSWSIHMLVDIVSKNGNLLLNVVQRPDGSLDPEVEQMLEQMAAWNKIHGEAIFGSRPWLVYGEGAVKAKGGHFNENFAYTSRDVRFTSKGSALYAIALGWPEDGKLTIRSLASSSDDKANRISSVSLLGYKGKIDFTQTTNGLIVTVPAQKVSEFTCALKIHGSNLKPVEIPDLVEPVRADASGNFKLGAQDAQMHGNVKTENQGGQPNIGFWDRGEDWVSWQVQFTQPGTYRATAACATINPLSEFVVEIAGQKLSGKTTETGSWSVFRNIDLGQFEITQPGLQTVKIRPRDPATWRPMNLRSLTITKVN